MKIGLVACSNGQSIEKKYEINRLISTLSEHGIEAKLSPCLYVRDGVASGSAKERAKALMDFYRDEEISDIFDVSGGDIANEVLPFLDFDVIKNSEKSFWGYSDLTTIINAIYTKTGKASNLYQIKNIVWDETGEQEENFIQYLKGREAIRGKQGDLYKEINGKIKKENKLMNIDCHFLCGSSMEGVVVGGNVRCFLKLAGTPYFPDMRDKILLMEALGGEEEQLRTYFSQLKQMGVFEQISGILLGTFTKYEEKKSDKEVYDILSPLLPGDLPVARAPGVGHSPDSRTVIIGGIYRFDN